MTFWDERYGKASQAGGILLVLFKRKKKTGKHAGQLKVMVTMSG